MNARIPRPLALMLRLCAGAGLAWAVASALGAPELTVIAKAAAIALFILTMWRADAGLVATVAVVPAGALLAAPPARCAELLTWSFLAGWLLAAWRPLAPRRPADETTIPATLYALCAVSSWLAYTVGGAAGTEPWRLPALVARTIRADHVVFTSSEPETFTLLPALAGLALFTAAAALTRERRALRRAIAVALAGSAAALALLTAADVLRQWAAAGYGGWYLYRYVEGSRFSLHLEDLNAAGSQYVLGGLIAAALAVAERGNRARWIGLAVLMAPALWISGSRSAALGGLLVGCSIIPLARRGIRVRLSPVHVALLLIVLAGVVGGAVLASGPAAQGTASNALWLRSQFLVTSGRMFASAPVFGVGIGHYHERSNEFMPPGLRAVYQHENAHNYFVQQFAELGLIGGAAFVWLVVAVLRVGWREVQHSEGVDAAALALLAGSAGYLLTCITGHPLLVPEAALPFWGAFGALAGAMTPAPETGSEDLGRPRPRQIAAAGMVLLLTADVVLQARRATSTTATPAERGFYALDKDDEGTPFVWMTRHGVFYIGPQPGFLRVRVQAPVLPHDRSPFTIAVEVAGRRAGVYEAPSGRWTTIEIPVRELSALPFRRVDLRANRSWTHRASGGRGGHEPRSVMIGVTHWMPAGAR